MSEEVGRGAARTVVVWESVAECAEELAEHRDGPLTVVDLGGGTGGLAVRLARLGHEVVVVDPSPDALASLRRRALEREVADRVRGVQGDAADLLDHVDAGSADLILCHGVLEYLDAPARAVEQIRRVLAPWGRASVLVHGRLAAVLARALAGDFTRARDLLDSTAEGWDVRTDGPRRYSPQELDDLLVASGLTPQVQEGVRVFSDLVPSALVETEPGSRAALLDLERSVAGRPEFAPVAGRLHVIAGLSAASRSPER